MSRQRVAFPSFRIEEPIKPYDMRQLVAALEYRFQSLEEQESTIPDTEFDDDLDARYALIDHNHVVADILDFDANVPSSVFDLDDVNGTPSVGQSLIWDGDEFLPGTAGGALALDDLTDVYVPTPADTQILTWVEVNNRWEATGLVGGGDTNELFDLLDTDLDTQTAFDLLYNDDGTNWKDTASLLKWNPYDGYLQLANSYSINWEDALFNSVELLTFTPSTEILGSWPQITSFTQIDSSEFNLASSRSFKFNDDGTTAYVCTELNGSEGVWKATTFGTAYNPDDTNTPTRIITTTTNYRGMTFNDDGTKVYLSADAGIEERANIGTPFAPGVGDIETLNSTFLIASTPREIHFRADGLRFWFATSGTLIREVNLSVAWDMSTAVSGISKDLGAGRLTYQVKISPDGLTAYMLGTATMWEYSMSAAFDISTLTDTTRSIAATTGATGGQSNGFDVSPDSKTLIIQIASDGIAAWNDSIRWTGAGGTPSISSSDIFIVGDPLFGTVIEGLTTNITSVATDIDGTLNVDGAITGQTTLDVDGAADFGGLVKVVGAASSYLQIGHESAAVGFSGLDIYGKQGPNNWGVRLAVESASLTFEGIGGTPTSSIRFEMPTVIYADGANVTMWDSTQTDNMNVKMFINGARWTISAGDSYSFSSDTGFIVLGGGPLEVQGGAVRISDSGNTDWAEFDHDGIDFNTDFTNTTDWNITGVTAISLTGAYQVSDAAGPTMVDEAATATNPTLIPNVADLDTGIGWAAADQLSLVSGGVEAIRYSTASSHALVDSEVHAGITAGTTQTQAGGFQLLSSHNEVATVANTNDTVVAPLASAGRVLTILNNGANTMQIFPAVGDDIGAGVDTVITLAAAGKVWFVSYDATTWTQFV